MSLSTFQEWRTTSNKQPEHLLTDRITAIIQQAGQRGVRHSDLLKAIDLPHHLITPHIELLRGLGEISVTQENGEVVIRSMRKLGGLMSGDLHHVARTRFIEK